VKSAEWDLNNLALSRPPLLKESLERDGSFLFKSPIRYVSRRLQALIQVRPY